MAEEKKVVEEKVEEPETVAKKDFDSLVAEYNRLGLAFKKLVDFCSRKYADELVTNLFTETDKELNKEADK